MSKNQPKIGLMLQNLDDYLSKLEGELEKLRTLHDQFFSGLSRIPPTRQLESFRRNVQNFPVAELRSTSQKFRFTNLKSKAQQMYALWSKISKQIEEGTYVRELNLQKLKQKHGQAESDTGTQATKARSATAVDALYEKLCTALKGKRIMQKEEFNALVQKQISEFKKEKPSEPYQIKLLKTKSGTLNVKVEAKRASTR